MRTTIEQLIQLGYLQPELETPCESDGFVSYLVNPSFVITTPSQINDNHCTINYVQLISDPGEPDVWVVQLEAYPEDPNNHVPTTEIEVDVYSKMSTLI